MTIKKEMSTQERYNVIIKNLHEAGMTDNEIKELFNDIREDLRKDGNASMTMDERIKKFCAFDKWAAKCTALVLPCGLKKSLFIHIKDYIRETEFENS